MKIACLCSLMLFTLMGYSQTSPPVTSSTHTTPPVFILDHIGLWTYQLETLKDFYTTHFDGKADAKFENPAYKFSSYFVNFPGARLEIMQMPDIPNNLNNAIKQHVGLVHIAFAVQSREQVREKTEQMRAKGFTIAAECTEYPDGYFESVVLDPDGNRVEISYYFGKDKK